MSEPSASEQAGSAGADAAADEVWNRGGGTSRDDVKAYAEAGGAAAAAAGCAALGAPAAAPVCATVGGYVAGAIAGALYDAFSSDDERERAKQEARSVAWAQYAKVVIDYIDAERAGVMKAVNRFFAENWDVVRDARVPRYETPWGPQQFFMVFNNGNRDPAPQFHEFEEFGRVVVPMMGLVSPSLQTAWTDLEGRWGELFRGEVSGQWGDDTEKFRKQVREKNEAVFGRVDTELRAGVASVLQQWATAGALYEVSGGREKDLEAEAERQRSRSAYYAAQEQAARKKGGSSKGPLIAGGLALGLLLLVKRR